MAMVSEAEARINREIRAADVELALEYNRDWLEIYVEACQADGIEPDPAAVRGYLEEIEQLEGELAELS